jgi:predicted nucleic acid-binding protein
LNVIDSSGWIEYFRDSPNAPFFEEILAGANQIIVPTICIYEVYKVLRRVTNEDLAEDAVGRMVLGTVVPLDAELATFAAGLSAEHKLATADSIVYATTLKFAAELWTQDVDFKDLPSVRYVISHDRK